MNKILAEWISKAEGDYAVANREMEASGGNCDAICFHSQQMAEKYLKAFLFKNKVDFPKIHNLVELLELCLVIDSSLEACLAFGDAEKIRMFMRVKLELND